MKIMLIALFLLSCGGATDFKNNSPECVEYRAEMRELLLERGRTKRELKNQNAWPTKGHEPLAYFAKMRIEEINDELKRYKIEGKKMRCF